MTSPAAKIEQSQESLESLRHPAISFSDFQILNYIYEGSYSIDLKSLKRGLDLKLLNEASRQNRCWISSSAKCFCSINFTILPGNQPMLKGAVTVATVKNGKPDGGFSEALWFQIYPQPADMNGTIFSESDLKQLQKIMFLRGQRTGVPSELADALIGKLSGKLKLI